MMLVVDSAPFAVAPKHQYREKTGITPTGINIIIIMMMMMMMMVMMKEDTYAVHATIKNVMMRARFNWCTQSKGFVCCANQQKQN